MRFFLTSATLSGFFSGAWSHLSSSSSSPSAAPLSSTAFCVDQSSSSTSLTPTKKDTVSDAVSMSLNFSEHRKRKREELKKEQQEASNTSNNNNNNNNNKPKSLTSGSSDNNPVRLVIVGGGYAGSQLAYKLDSVFDVTLIDEKNFLENRMEMTKILCSPWDSTNPDALKRSSSLAAAAHFIHRVYLRRANVVTGTVEYVQFDPPSGRKKTKKAAVIMNSVNDETKKSDATDSTSLSSSSSSTSSLLSSLASTLTIRGGGGAAITNQKEDDDTAKKFVRLKDGRTVPFDLIIFSTGEEHAFPFSTKQKTSDQRLAEVKHFCDFLARCHKVAVIGGGPLGCSVAGYLASGRPDMTVDLYNKHPQLLPNLPKNMRAIAEEALGAFTNLKIHHSSTVEDVASHVIDSRPDWEKLKSGGDVSKNLNKAIELTSPPSAAEGATSAEQLQQLQLQQQQQQHQKIDISFDLNVRTYPAEAKQKNPSIFVRCWMGDEFRGEMPALDPNEKSRLAHERLANSTITKEKGYDYVFVCTGGTPRSDVFHKSPELRGHVDGKGHVRVSKYFQLYGYPEAFALGRDCALPFTRSIGNSNLMTNTMFRALLSRFGEGASSNQVMSKMSQDAHCIVPQRFAIPRITIPLGPTQVVSCGAWYGPSGGENAQKEKKAEEGLFREFKAPKFFKAQSPAKVRERFDKWSETCSTPVVDFTYTAELI